MSTGSPGLKASEDGAAEQEDEDSDLDEADEYLIADALDKSDAPSSGYSSYGADDYSDDETLATKEDDTYTQADSVATTSTKR